MVTLGRIAFGLIEDALRWVVLVLRSTETIRAENLFLRRQLALFIERGVRLRRAIRGTGSFGRASSRDSADARCCNEAIGSVSASRPLYVERRKSWSR
jgi:hypothetical protein